MKKGTPKYKVNNLHNFTKKHADEAKKTDQLLNARSRSKSSQSKKSGSLKKLNRLKRKDSEDSEDYVEKQKSESQESEEDIKNKRFFIGDAAEIDAEIKQIEQYQRRKKSKNQAIDEMIKKQKQNPKSNSKKSQKMTSEQKEKLHQKAMQQAKKKKEQAKKQEDNDDRSLDSDQQRLLRMKRMQAREDQNDLLKIAIQLSLKEAQTRKKQEQDIAKALKQSLKLESSASKTTHIQSPKKQDDDEVDNELLNLYEQRKKQQEKSKAQKKKKAESKKKAETKQKQNVIYGPLTKKTFVITGVFPEGKDRIADMLKSLGAAVRGSVSRKTDYLLQGTILEDGRQVDTSTKSRQAMELGVKIVKYADLDSVMVKLTNKTISQNLEYKPLDKIMTKEVKIQKMQIEASKDDDSRLWIDKYKPTKLQEIIGQNSQIQNLVKWLRTWQDVHFKGIKHEVKQFFNHSQPFQGGGSINSKAALISGEPGIGKTTAARMVCKLLDYDYVEFNASDIRNKNNILGLQWNSLTLSGQLKQSKRVMIMDEIDGMSGGDRGGIQAIIKMIKEAKAPVICICNDRQHEKIRTLANYCYDVKFFKPNKTSVCKRIMDILARQGIPAEQQSVLHLVQTFNGDMRQILNYLNMASRMKSKLTYLDTKESLIKNRKDTLNSLNKWNASTKLLNRVQFSKMKIYERLQLFFSQTDMIPLMIEDSLMSSMLKKNDYKLEDINNLASAYDSIALSDVVNKHIWGGQQWSLMPVLGFLSCVYPPEKVSNAIGYPKFPQWFGKNSTSRKIIREVRQLKWALSGVITGNNKAVQHDYARSLMQTIIKGLQDEDIDGVVTFMEDYNIRPEMIKEHLQDLIYNPEKVVFFDVIPPQIKSKLTRAYNKRHEQAFKEKRAKQVGGQTHAQKYNDVLDEMEVEVEEEEAQPEGQNKQSQANVVAAKGKGKTKSKK